MINPTIAANIAKTQVEYLEEAWSRAEEGFDTYHDAAEHATDLLTVRDALETSDAAIATRM